MLLGVVDPGQAGIAHRVLDRRPARFRQLAVLVGLELQGQQDGIAEVPCRGGQVPLAGAQG